MSRSTRKPYMAITGNASAKDDKQLAARGARRRQNQSIRSSADYEELLIPHKLECTFNNNHNWGRDGSQMYWPEGKGITRK